MRSDQCFDLFWEKVAMKAEQRSVETPLLPRRRKIPSRFETGQAPAEFHSISKDYYRQNYFEAMEHIVQAITDRFGVYLDTEQLLLKCVRGEHYQEKLSWFRNSIVGTFTKPIFNVSRGSLPQYLNVTERKKKQF
jgi:hypothetical protein